METERPTIAELMGEHSQLAVLEGHVQLGARNSWLIDAVAELLRREQSRESERGRGERKEPNDE